MVTLSRELTDRSNRSFAPLDAGVEGETPELPADAGEGLVEETTDIAGAATIQIPAPAGFTINITRAATELGEPAKPTASPNQLFVGSGGNQDRLHHMTTERTVEFGGGHGGLTTDLTMRTDATAFTEWTEATGFDHMITDRTIEFGGDQVNIRPPMASVAEEPRTAGLGVPKHVL